MSFHLFDVPDRDLSDHLSEAGLFLALLGRRHFADDYKPGELRKLLAQQRKMLHAALHEGKFGGPNFDYVNRLERELILQSLRAAGESKPKLPKDTPWRPDDSADIQIGAAYALACFGDPVGIDALDFYLRQGPQYYRQMALLDIHYCWRGGTGPFGDEELSPLPPRVVEAMRACTTKSAGDALLVARAAQWVGLPTLLPDLLDACRRATGDSAKAIAMELACFLTDDKLLAELMQDWLPRLSLEELFRWTSELQSDAERLRRSKANNEACELRLHWAQTAFNRWTDKATKTDFAQATKNWHRSENCWKLLQSKHRPFLERLLKPPRLDDAEAEARAKKHGEALLSRLDPQKRVSYLIESGTEFEVIAREVLGQVRPADRDRLVEAAASAARKAGAHPFDDASVTLLWAECGPAGRELLLKKPAACSVQGLRQLVWLVENLSAKDAAESLVALGLSALSADELLKRYEDEVSADRSVRQNAPYAAFRLLSLVNRHAGFDGESGDVPPDYHWLLGHLCQATAGHLQFQKATVKPEFPGKDYDRLKTFQVKFHCNGKQHAFDAANLGDWFDADACLEALTKILKSLRTKERFHHVLADGQCAELIFGPLAAIAEYSHQFAIPLLADPSGSDAEQEFRAACVKRMKTATARKNPLPPRKKPPPTRKSRK